MKHLTILFILFAFISDAQESKPKVSQQMFIEPNVGVGRFHYYTDLSDNVKDILPTTSLGIYYRSKKFKLGLDLNYCFEFGMISPRVQTSYNFLDIKLHPNYFTGPIVGFGVRKNLNYEGLPYMTIGLDNYFHNVHLAVKYDILHTRGHYSFIKNARMLYLEVGYSFHLGFQK